MTQHASPRDGRGRAPRAQSSAARRRATILAEVRSTKPREAKRKTRRIMTNLRRALIAKTGLLPLDFLTAVYRDELYSDYDRVMAKDGRTHYYVPTKSAKRIRVSLDKRISAATSAAPYMHKKMPQGIEVSDRSERTVLAEQLQALPTKDLLMLEALFTKLDKLRAPPSLKGAALMGARTYTQEGEEIPVE